MVLKFIRGLKYTFALLKWGIIRINCHSLLWAIRTGGESKWKGILPAFFVHWQNRNSYIVKIFTSNFHENVQKYTVYLAKNWTKGLIYSMFLLVCVHFCVLISNSDFMKTIRYVLQNCFHWPSLLNVGFLFLPIAASPHTHTQKTTWKRSLLLCQGSITQVCQQKLQQIQPVTPMKGHVRLQSKFLVDKTLEYSLNGLSIHSVAPQNISSGKL